MYRIEDPSFEDRPSGVRTSEKIANDFKALDESSRVALVNQLTEGLNTEQIAQLLELLQQRLTNQDATADVNS